MKKLFENENLIIHYDEDKKLYIEEWTEASSNKTEEQWYEDHKIVRDIVNEYKPEYVLSYSDKSTFPVSPEMQKWYSENIVKPIAQYVKKAAVVLPKEFIARLGLEQLISEIKSVSGNTMTIHYFDDREAAKKWLGI